MKPPRPLHVAMVVFALALVGACSRSADADLITAAPPKPKEAATQVEQAFSTADEELRTVAGAASAALRTADYEAAVQSLSLMKEQGNLTLDQGLAVHNSMVSLESQLISAVAAGDPGAVRAYEQLKRSRRN